MTDCCGGDAWFGSFLLWGAFLALIVVGVVLMARAWPRPSERGVRRPAGETRSSALEILDERYARGEIDQAELEERRATLQSDAGRRLNG